LFHLPSPPEFLDGLPGDKDDMFVETTRRFEPVVRHHRGLDIHVFSFPFC
jgi:hypothetical protein